jgi:beta-mannosidase
MSALLALGRWLLAGHRHTRRSPSSGHVAAARPVTKSAGHWGPSTSHQPAASSQRRAPLLWLMMTIGTASAQESHIPLNDGWSFCQVGKEQWYSAEVPGVVQTDLLRHGLIPDFYQGSNIDSVQWIENEDWIYKRTIVANDSLLKHGHVDLVFKGLDTFAEVYLNDSLLGKADNMFRTWEWGIKELLRPGANQVKVIFRSPIKEGAKLRDAYGIQLPHDNDPTGVSPYIRKAAYQFGWDFCPRLVTSGIWQGVELRGWSEARIHQVDYTRSGAHLLIHIHEMRDRTASVRGRYKVYLNDSLIAQCRARDLLGPSTILDESRLGRWGLNGSRSRTVYDVRVTHEVKGRVLSERHVPFADRNIVWDFWPDTIGKAFKCLVNGKAQFIRGCNVVPPRVIPVDDVTHWVALVTDMQRAGMNMARIWGGGIYPPDEFYSACDTAGILVWLDYMVANLLPGEDQFGHNIRAEAYEQVQRVKYHPCLALMCGNNEMRVAWSNWGWQERYRIHGDDSVRVGASNEKLWTRTLMSPAFPLGFNYTPTSPLSNWGNAEGLKNGDLHYWGVWHGDSAFSSFKNNVGRFVSEYGFQSYPDSALLAKYNDPKDLYLGSPTMKRLQRSYKTDKPIWDAIKRELGKEPRTLGEFIEDSQEVQAKAYRMAIEAHMAAQPHCMGTLFWQLNDCWPGPSWSLIDYEGNWKPGMYEVQRLYDMK